MPLAGQDKQQQSSTHPGQFTLVNNEWTSGFVEVCASPTFVTLYKTDRCLFVCFSLAFRGVNTQHYSSDFVTPDYLEMEEDQRYPSVCKRSIKYRYLGRTIDLLLIRQETSPHKN